MKDDRHRCATWYSVSDEIVLRGDNEQQEHRAPRRLPIYRGQSEGLHALGEAIYCCRPVARTAVHGVPSTRRSSL
jgi:hypothetical protein